MRIQICFFTLILFSTVLCFSQEHNYKPKEGYVPDKETAMKIAEAVWLPIYGERVKTEKPYKATLHANVWFVEGTLQNGFTVGGVALAEIAKDDGKVIRVSHGK